MSQAVVCSRELYNRRRRVPACLVESFSARRMSARKSSCRILVSVHGETVVVHNGGWKQFPAEYPVRELLYGWQYYIENNLVRLIL